MTISRASRGADARTQASPAVAASPAPAAPAIDDGTLRAETERAAYDLYEKRGRLDGHDMEDWLEAERSVRERFNGGK